MSPLSLELARPSDDAELRRLLRENPMPGRFSLSLRREPSFFLGATIEGDEHRTLVARRPGEARLCAMGSCSVRDAWLDGRSRRLGYLGQLRVDRGARDGSAVLGLLEGLREVRSAPFHLATIVEDNLPARRGLEREWPGKPSFQRWARLRYLVLPFLPRPRLAPPAGCELRRGSRELLPELSACLERNHARTQFAPRWTESSLVDAERARGLAAEDFWVALRGGRVVGCLATWDQRGFKQLVVERYPGGAWRLRHLVNLASRVVGGPRLPEPGTPLAHAYLSHVAVDDQDPHLFLALLDVALRERARRGCGLLSLGFAEQHPLLAAVRSRHLCLEHGVLLYLVYFEEQRLAALALDRARLPHVEIAVL